MATLVGPSRLIIETAVGEGRQQQDKAVGEGKQQQDKLQGLVFGARYAVLPSYVLGRLGEVESVCKGEGDATKGVETLAGRVDELIAKKKSAGDPVKVSKIDLAAPGIVLVVSACSESLSSRRARTRRTRSVAVWCCWKCCSLIHWMFH